MNGSCCATGADCAAKGGCPLDRGPPNCVCPLNGGGGCCGGPKLGGTGCDEVAAVGPGWLGNAGRCPPNIGGAGCNATAGGPPNDGGCEPRGPRNGGTWDAAMEGPPNGGGPCDVAAGGAPSSGDACDTAAGGPPNGGDACDAAEGGPPNGGGTRDAAPAGPPNGGGCCEGNFAGVWIADRLDARATVRRSRAHDEPITRATGSSERGHDEPDRIAASDRTGAWSASSRRGQPRLGSVDATKPASWGTTAAAASRRQTDHLGNQGSERATQTDRVAQPGGRIVVDE
jgi:hypothetical protein